MTNAIAQQRLRNQCVTHAARRKPADLVAWLGAVQAQEYPAARWGLALRMPEGTTDQSIQRAVDNGRIVRIHVLRPTWHFVTPADIRWMLDLTAPRVHRVLATYHRQLELDAALLARATAIFERALEDRGPLTRAELGAELARAGVTAKGIRLALMTIYAELEGVICSGPHRGKHSTYAPLAGRVPRLPMLSRDEALAELVLRYFRSHGPATIRDFVWWSGLSTADVKRGLEINRATRRDTDGLTYWSIGRSRPRGMNTKSVQLLPIYDEYLVAYRDRVAVPHVTAGTIRAPSGETVTFKHALVIGGQVAGMWKLRRGASGTAIEVFPSRTLSRSERRRLSDAAARFARFVAAPVSVEVA